MYMFSIICHNISEFLAKLSILWYFNEDKIDKSYIMLELVIYIIKVTHISSYTKFSASSFRLSVGIL